MNNEQDIEQKIQQKNLNAPRITPDKINSVIANVEYMIFPNSCTTVCQITTRNGFGVIGTSACASPENFNAEIGQNKAFENARAKIWELEGYLLKEKLSNTHVEAIAKVCHELIVALYDSIDDYSQENWVNSPQWHKDSIINGVKFHIANPGATPWASHDNWYQEKKKDGWVYGPVENPELKEHPCMVPYDDLPSFRKSNDYIFRQAVHSFASLYF